MFPVPRMVCCHVSLTNLVLNKYLAGCAGTIFTCTDVMRPYLVWMFSLKYGKTLTQWRYKLDRDTARCCNLMRISAFISACSIWLHSCTWSSSIRSPCVARSCLLLGLLCSHICRDCLLFPRVICSVLGHATVGLNCFVLLGIQF